MCQATATKSRSEQKAAGILRRFRRGAQEVGLRAGRAAPGSGGLAPLAQPWAEGMGFTWEPSTCT